MGPSNLAAALQAVTGYEPVRSTGGSGSDLLTVRLDSRRLLCVDPTPGRFEAIVFSEGNGAEELEVVSEAELLRVVAALMAGTSST